MTDIKIPEVGESIKEVQIASWLKSIGDFVEEDEDLVELETEKASVPLPAPCSGVLESIAFEDGAFVAVGAVIGVMNPDANGDGSANSESSVGGGAATATVGSKTESKTAGAFVMPAAQRVLDDYKISADVVTPSGPNGRLLKEDVLNYIEANNLTPPETTASNAGGSTSAKESSPKTGASSKPESSNAANQISTSAPTPSVIANSNDPNRVQTRKPMSMIRRTIANRLVEAQQQAALLTTFNEIDMQPVMSLRSKYKESFLEKHGVKLGFMSFFAKASVEALRRFPAINAQIDGNDVVYHEYFDIGIAIGGGKGLVVPVLRNVERMSFADIERQIGIYGAAAKENKLTPSELTGGTFTISNGGVYGSLLSTPIVNPPQSGILGLHAIQERPIAINGQIEIRPMMYVALTYDHRIVDGREAVVFLKTIKEVLEEPARLFLEI